MSFEEAGNSETVLVVDDDNEVRQFVVTVLSRQGYRILQSSSGIEALSHAEQDRPKIDILVTDISLLDTDGIALAEHFVTRFPEAGVVLISGFAGIPRSRLENLAARWVFVEKPFPLQKLVDAVRGVLSEAGGERAA
jgi:two-component system, cell cycle sensor histidine kinase and response regulator CckA